MGVRGPHGSSIRARQVTSVVLGKGLSFQIIVGGELKGVLVYLSFLSGPLLCHCSSLFLVIITGLSELL